jgi:hypothetical protein
VVQSRSKRQVTSDEKAAECLEESALALALVCEEVRVAAVALDNAKAEHGQLAAARKISLFVACKTQLSLWHLGEKPSHYHTQPSPWKN